MNIIFLKPTHKGSTFPFNFYESFKDELLKDPKVKTVYESLKPEYNIMQILIDVRKTT